MYNLNDINIYKNKDYIKIKEDNKEYILYKIYNPQRIIEINNILKNQTEYYKIVKNINNEIITIYQDKYYVLLEINTKYLIQSNNIILNNNEYSNYQINQSNWIYLWTKKNDYYESISINNNYINETINYYIEKYALGKYSNERYMQIKIIMHKLNYLLLFYFLCS